MTDTAALSFDDYAADAAVVGIYQQVFAVLARESHAMIDDADSVAVDEAILTSFVGAGPGGMSVDQVVAACGAHSAARVRRRFEVLRSYRAVVRANERPNEMFYQATFAPYVMLLFLRRLGDSGGQAELHQLLSVARLSLDDAGISTGAVRTQLAEMTNLFRLLANPLAQLARSASIESLRGQARPLLGNGELLATAQEYHDAAATRRPELLPECAELRMALAAYRDAVNVAAQRLLAHAGKTRALGLLPAERWRSFARTSDAAALAGVLDGLLFDAPAPQFTVEALLDAVEEGLHVDGNRMPPPRPRLDDEPPAAPVADQESALLGALAEELLAGRDEVTVGELLADAGPWAAARRVLSQLTAIHLRDELPYALSWDDGLRVDLTSTRTWVSDGWLRRE
jgi:hypothetical protein